MKSYNHKFIKICSSMKVSLFLSLTDDVYSLFRLQHCLQKITVSPTEYSNTMALILIIIIFIIMYLLTDVTTMLMATSTFSFSASMFRVHKCACIIKFHVA